MLVCPSSQSFQKYTTKLPSKRAEPHTNSPESRIQIHMTSKGKEVLDAKGERGPEKLEGTKKTLFINNLQKQKKRGS